MSEPACKKRRLSSVHSMSNESLNCDDYRVRQILAEELDLEIALRQRLATTIESRVTWAFLLQDALTNTTTVFTPGSYKDAAMEAIDVVESACNILFDRECCPPQNIQDIIERSSQESLVSEPAPLVKPRNRTVRPSRPRQEPQGAKVLFIRNTTVFPPTVAKMVCPDCSRSDFTNLQGLLNHARLRHKKEYGSHDECMQSCAVIVDHGEDGEAEWVVKNGIELAAVNVPSLRRLFEIAVGDDKGFVDGFGAAGVCAVDGTEDARPVSGSYLSQTLGHHKDTPALAPFLGRASIRRCINVHDDDDIVDIDYIVTPKASSWRMSLPHRNKARPELDVIAESTQVCDLTTQTDSTPPITIATQNNSGTRFHIIARVTVSDRSVWIPPERRAKSLPNLTHRWVLAVDSPSYSLHISTFLTRMTVTCLSDPPPPTLLSPLSITEPPFEVSGTTDRPFLAKVTLTWVGPQNVPMDVEHWVELELLHSAIHPVLGDEQVLDVELDRHTELMPTRRGTATRKRKVHDYETAEQPFSSTTPIEHDTYFEAKLRSLLPNYPMTLKDVKGRTSISRIPYKLVTTPSQLRSLVAGRRLAIEWSRARAIRDAYQVLLLTEPPENLDDAIDLTTADVFRWLEDKGQFIRPVVEMMTLPPQEATKVSTPPPLPLCSVCGQSHSSVIPGLAVETEGAVNMTCTVVHDHSSWHRMTIVDVRRLLGSLPPDHPSTAQFSSSTGFLTPGPVSYASTIARSRSACADRDLVAVAKPDVICAIRDMVQSLNLVSFKELASTPSLCLLGHKSEVESQLAPYALLATLTKSFVGLLVQSGMDAAILDASMTATQAKGEARGYRKAKTAQPYVLTPSHIFRGLAGGPNIAVATALARLGCTTVQEPITMGTLGRRKTGTADDETSNLG